MIKCAAFTIGVLMLVPTVTTAQDGRWKLGGDGSCYWDANDSGPNQCEQTAGRYKLGGDGSCYWDANDSGANQCDPPQAAAEQAPTIPPDQLASLARLTGAWQDLHDAGFENWTDQQRTANAWWVIMVYQWWGVPEAYGITVQDAYDVSVNAAAAGVTSVATRLPTDMLVLKIQKRADCAETKAKAGKATRLGLTVAALSWTNYAAAAYVGTYMFPVAPPAAVATAASFGLAGLVLEGAALAIGGIAYYYDQLPCSAKGENTQWRFPMIHASVVQPRDPWNSREASSWARWSFCA